MLSGGGEMLHAEKTACFEARKTAGCRGGKTFRCAAPGDGRLKEIEIVKVKRNINKKGSKKDAAPRCEQGGRAACG